MSRPAKYAPNKLRKGLYRNADGCPWLYEFKWKGQRLKGSTHCRDRRDAVAWLDAYRRQLAFSDVGLAPDPRTRSSLPLEDLRVAVSPEEGGRVRFHLEFSLPVSALPAVILEDYPSPQTPS